MAIEYKSRQWCATTESVRGATHIASGLPNQDAIAVKQMPEGLIMAISDGHGSSRYVRSDVGALLAVDIAIQELSPLAKETGGRFTSGSELESRLTQVVVRNWDKAVAAHLAESPLSADERARSGVAVVDDHLCYGATLLAVVATSSFVLYLQLGDGDILVVERSGNILRPIPKDPALIGNETTSLCSPESWNSMRLIRRVTDPDNRDEHPMLVLAATDGYANCFKDESSFLKAAKDFHELLSQPSGLSVVSKHLNEWLRDSSDNYSGDDISLALLSRRGHRKDQGRSKGRAS